MVPGEGKGNPIGTRLESASPSEAKPAEAVLAKFASRGHDPLARAAQETGIDLTAPYRNNNKLRHLEDGPKRHRYKRRWIADRAHAWLEPFRRPLVRHQHLVTFNDTFFHLACFWIRFRTHF
jgi:transposase